MTVPIVGYVTVELDDTTNESDAKEKALDLCRDFENKKVDIIEMYGVEHVVQGNCVNHPLLDIEIEKLSEKTKVEYNE